MLTPEEHARHSRYRLMPGKTDEQIVDGLTKQFRQAQREILERIVGWRERDWPEGFDRRTAEMFADYARTLMEKTE